PITVATADLAVMDDDGSRITLKGNAHLHRVADAEREPLDIHSEVLVLFPDDDIAETDLAALIQQGQSTLNGTGMRYNNAKRTLQVFSATDAKLSGQDRPTKQN
ncbi:MAG TPA: LPS export ABC transporter periplasmic protein LptC, partial [Burkholderiaceae bacterium]|nr:LPS export ABC transporter periplasmic protein LptC [Burkholderiaceae bacterium]